MELLPAIVDELAERVDGDRHGDPSSSVRSAAAGIAHVAHVAAERGLDTAGLDAVAALAARAVAAGGGDDEISRLVGSVALAADRPD